MPDYSRLLRRLAGNNEIEAPELDYEGVESDLLDAVNKLPDENRSIPQQPATPQQQEQVVADPESSAIDEYKKYLKEGPSSQERWGRVLAAAADTFGGGGGAFTKLRQGIPSEGARLKEAAKLEQQEKDSAQKMKEFKLKMELRNRPDLSKQQTQDFVALEKMQGIVAGNNSRKGKLIAKGRDRIKTSNIMLDMIKKFDAGALTFDDPSNTQYAAAFAKLMGTSSGIEIVNKFKYKSAFGAIQDMRAYLSGDPKTTVTDEMMKEIRIMSTDMAKNEQEAINKAVARELNAYAPRLRRNPDQFQAVIEDYQNDSGEVLFDPKTNRFKPVLTRDISVKEGGQSIQPTQMKAPHGNRVRQNGVNYIWNGSEYIKE